MLPFYLALAAGCSLASARSLPRTVAALDGPGTAEAQQRDDTATRALANVRITTADGRCLFVDKLSGDARANLTPVQVAACGSTDGQGWDVITAGRHIDSNLDAAAALVVSTLTNACLNFDPRRPPGSQVILFSCGGRADGGGDVTDSQLFSFNGTTTGPLALKPSNAAGQCLVVKDNVVDVASCRADANQQFTFGATNVTALASSSASSTPASSTTPSSVHTTPTVTGTVTDTVTSSSTAGVANNFAAGSDFTSSLSSSSSSSSSPTPTKATAIPIPTAPVPVARGGSLFDPAAAAAANERDTTATRAFSAATIRAPNGQCLFVDPTAGDARLNLVPLQLVDCAGTPNEQFDVITAGKHNSKEGSALIVSTLTNGCVSLDVGRAANDTVNLFSCGGRADGSGGTDDKHQTIFFNGALSFALAPTGAGGKTCLLPGDDRLVSGSCPTDGSELFSIFPAS